LFRFSQPGFRELEAPLGLLGSHHDLELAVLGLRDFRLGVGNFMLERAVGFVGFHRAALVAVFANAIRPFLAFEFELLALGVDLRERFFGGRDFRAGAALLGVCFAKALREGFEVRAKKRNPVVHSLQLNQMGNRGVHGTPILSQSHGGPSSRAHANHARTMMKRMPREKRLECGGPVGKDL